jgi:hypothetical protein
MRSGIAVICVLAAGSGPAAADPDVGGYAEPSLLVGVASIHGTQYGDEIDETAAVVGARVTLGLRLDEHAGRHWRVGGAFALLSGPGNGAMLGIEAGVDWSVSPTWRLGPRFELGYGDDLGEGVRVGAGVTARRGALILGLDAFGGPSYFADMGPEAGFDGYAFGVVSRVGVGGRAGVYTEVAVLVGTLVAVIALGQAFEGTH